MNKVLAVACLGVALCSAMAFADPDPARVPLANAEARVSENLADHPNRGLANAHERIRDNILRQQAKRENHPPGQQKKVAGTKSGNQGAGGSSGSSRGGADRAQVAERVERVERPERPEKADRPERAEKVDRPARPDKPDRPGRNK